MKKIINFLSELYELMIPKTFAFLIIIVLLEHGVRSPITFFDYFLIGVVWLIAICYISNCLCDLFVEENEKGDKNG